MLVEIVSDRPDLADWLFLLAAILFAVAAIAFHRTGDFDAWHLGWIGLFFLAAGLLVL